jgi:hypothetical protein
MITLEEKIRRQRALSEKDKIFFDTEFIDDKSGLLLLSIGLVKDNGQSYYAEVAETDRSMCNEWVQQNVLPLMQGPVKSKYQIAREIAEFVGPNPEFWAYFAAFDWVLLCRLYDGMMQLPKGWPHFCHDILMVMAPNFQMPQQDPTCKHHALHDAQWNKEVYDAAIKHNLNK